MSKRKKPKRPQCIGSNTGKLKPTEIVAIQRDLRNERRRKKVNSLNNPHIAAKGWLNSISPREIAVRRANKYAAVRQNSISETMQAQRREKKADDVKSGNADTLLLISHRLEKSGCLISVLAFTFSLITFLIIFFK
jgi:hypothetical protein